MLKKIFCIIFILCLKYFLVAQVNTTIIDTTKKSNLTIHDPNFSFKAAFVKLPNYYIPNLALFCKLELDLQKQTVIPIKFRLGSQQVADFQEGKNNFLWKYRNPDLSMCR